MICIICLPNINELVVDDLYTYFNNFGDVRVAEVMFHRGTQNPRGFGFVTFAKEEEAQSVLRREMNVINGEELAVFECKQDFGF